MLKRRQLAFIGLGMLVGMGTIVKADTVVGSSSVSTQKSVLDQIGEKAALSFFGLYRGASLGDMGNAYQPTTTGAIDDSSPQSIESLVTTGYKLNPDLMVGVTWHFYYFPVRNPSGGDGQDIQMLDPMLTVSKAKMIDTGPFKLSGKLYVALPMSSADSLLPRHDAMSIAPTLIASYDFPKSPFSVGIYSYLKGYVPTANTPDSARAFKLYVAPNANYQVSGPVAITLWVDLIQATVNRNQNLVTGLDNYAMDIEPGVNIDISKNISINPILNIYPASPTLAATSLQAILVAKAF